MIEGFDPTEIIACAMRPAGSLLHLLTLVGFVLAARAVGGKRTVRGKLGGGRAARA